MWPSDPKGGRAVGRGGNFFSNTIDGFFRYLRNIQRQPVPVQVSVGAVGGL